MVRSYIDYVRPADIMLPRAGVDLARFAVIACDQHTSDPGYWERVRLTTEGAPSAYNLILPEIYLEEMPARLPSMHDAMRAYKRGALDIAVKDGFVYVKRLTSGGVRRGLVAAIDLERYSFDAQSGAAIRATEGVVPERLPARVRIRDGATLELPHVLVLFEDRGNALFGGLDARKELRPLYGFDLMEGGGHIEGYAVETPENTAFVLETLAACAARSAIKLAVGDGNHSLAAAKALWDESKRALPEAQFTTHPLRFALVELCNLYDTALRFEAIHRVLFGVDADDVLSRFTAKVGAADAHTVECVHAGGRLRRALKRAHTLHVGTLQAFIDGYIAEHPGARVDYIHGEEACAALARQPGALAFLLPAMDKELLFPSVERDGALPRKTFSMGHAQDKRYYLEARALE